MRFFAVPYQIHFDDTMAYGSHHFLTNLKFQCYAREMLYFREGPDGIDHWKRDLDNIILLTHEGYCKNMAPARLGEKLAIFMSIGEISRSSITMCFRTIREDGTLITCGWQRVIVVGKDGQAMLPVPQSMTQFGMIRETCPNFCEDLLKGGRRLKSVFPATLVAAAGEVARTLRSSGFVDVTEAGVEWDPLPVLAGATLSHKAEGFAMMFPGQGAFHLSSLRNLYQSESRFQPEFEIADRLTKQHFGHPFLPLVVSETMEESRLALDAFPDLDQVGIFLSGVLAARLLREEGLEPTVVFGHSFGEITAMAVAGVFDLATGIDIVCRRVKALRPSSPGIMAAFPCAEARLRPLLKSPAGIGVDIAVLNSETQTVVSGRADAMAAFLEAARIEGLTGVVLRSRYPFHSSQLASAAKAFAADLRDIRPGKALIPVFSPIDGRFYEGDVNAAAILPTHLTRRLDFQAAIKRLHVKGVRLYIECGVGDILTKLVKRNLGDTSGITILNSLGFGETIEAARSRLRITLAKLADDMPPEATKAETPLGKPSPVNERPLMPIAIIGAGMVLPQAGCVDALWRNILNAVNGVVDMGTIDPLWQTDFASEGGIRPDKTYSTISGYVSEITPDLSTLPWSEAEFLALGRAQRMLAQALSQALASTQNLGKGACRFGVILGSTADGYGDTEGAHLRTSLEEILSGLDAPQAHLNTILEIVSQALHWSRPGQAKGQYAACREVVESLAGTAAEMLLVDAACASSLYALDLGMRRLRSGVWDTALVGGVYETGPGNQCLFSQFGGLSPTDSRPFDASADGVVFGEGAGVVVLKRLSDALADGDRILGVLRGSGLSSDGKSPAVNVPQSAGQELAMRRAYAATGIDPQSIQFIEAHATATPVGDATEFAAMNKAFAGRDKTLPPIELGSLKALLGHTGWVAGIASLLKVCLAMKDRTIPGQAKLTEVSSKLALAASPFTISREAKPWPDNRFGLPRRAAINGFGFGGTNAHVVVEEFVPGFHRTLVEQAVSQAAAPHQPKSWAVVGAGTVFPSEGARFPRQALSLPKGRLMLPDVTDAMDSSQYLGLMAAEKALAGIGDGQKRALADETAVVVGMEGRTHLGVLANERLYRDRIMRTLSQAIATAGGQRDGLKPLVAAIGEAIGNRSHPSTPYTLPGVMPNVTSGRIANVFHLRGPNFVVDTGRDSLADSVRFATELLADGTSRMVLVGGVNAASTLPAALTASGDQTVPLSDGAVMLALVHPDTAAELALPVLATLTLDDGDDSAVVETVVAEPANFRGATGGWTIGRAIDAARAGRSLKIRWDAETIWTVASATVRTAEDVADRESASGFVTNTPIRFFRPDLFAVASSAPAVDLRRGKVLLVTDQPDLVWSARDGGALDGVWWRLAVPADAVGADAEAVPVDLSSEAALAASLATLDPSQFDHIVAVCDLSRIEPLSLLDQPWAEQSRFLDLLFALARHSYGAVRSGASTMTALCLGGRTSSGRLHPVSGAVAGFMKSLIRELPEGNCCLVSTTEQTLVPALAQAALELGRGRSHGTAAEIWYLDGVRHQIRFVPLAASDPATGSAQVDSESVILLTGGGRGVTAVLAEAVLQRFGGTVILVGRTNLSDYPQDQLEVDENTFAAGETEYYRAALAAEPGVKMPELKRRRQALTAARELKRVLQKLKGAPGETIYVSADITDQQAINELFSEIVRRFGRLDLVVHGAGIQSSKRLPSRKLAEFRAIIGTKLTGLHVVHQACERSFPGRSVGFHMLTSAFSSIGNDGQPDYGAANEAMNRLAEWFSGRAGQKPWSTIAWLGWNNIGMTRGSEYSTLASGRGIRGVTAGEGGDIFTTFLSAPPPAPVNIPLTEGEITTFQLDIAGNDDVAGTTFEWPLSLSSHPHFQAHRVNGLPAVPGTFELELIARTVARMARDFVVCGFRDCVFHSLVRLKDIDATALRIVCGPLHEEGADVTCHATVYSDFTHASGRVLQKNVLRIEATVHLARVSPVSLPRAVEKMTVDVGTPAPDPYTHPSAPVSHQGLFRHLHAVRLGTPLKEAFFHLGGDRALDTDTDCLTPWLLEDACLSFCMLEINSHGEMPVFVPLRIASISFLPGVTDWTMHERYGAIRLVAPNLKRNRDSETAEVQTAGWVQAVDAEGRVLVEVKGAVGRLFTLIPHEAASGWVVETEPV